MADALLEVDEIETCYGLSQVLFGLTLSIRAGEMVSLMGRNGMGKTTTIRSIMGLTPARSGAIRFGGNEVRQLPSYRIAKLGIGLVPEGRQVFPNLTTRENLVATAANRGAATEPWTLDKVLALFPRLASRAGTMATLLSGGEQQMLAIGRALMSRPRMLLLDEPSMGLAPLMVQKVFETVLSVSRSGVTILLIEQNAKLALEVSTHAYVMESGEITLAGDSKALLHDPKVQAAYLGGA